MFVLPTLAVAPVVNSVGAGTLPVVDGALYGWVLIVTLVVAAFGILRASQGANSSHANLITNANRPMPVAPKLRIVDAPNKVAA